MRRRRSLKLEYEAWSALYDSEMKMERGRLAARRLLWPPSEGMNVLLMNCETGVSLVRCGCYKLLLLSRINKEDGRANALRAVASQSFRVHLSASLSLHTLLVLGQDAGASQLADTHLPWTAITGTEELVTSHKYLPRGARCNFQLDMNSASHVNYYSHKRATSLTSLTQLSHVPSEMLLEERLSAITSQATNQNYAGQ